MCVYVCEPEVCLCDRFIFLLIINCVYTYIIYILKQNKKKARIDGQIICVCACVNNGENW